MLTLSTKLVALLVAVGVLASCASLKQGRLPAQPDGDYCEPTLRYAYDTAFMPRPDLLPDSGLLPRYTRHDLLMANATGVLPLLLRMERLPTGSQPDTRLDRLAIRQAVLGRLLTAVTEIASLAAELDCEGERTDQLATYLDERDTRRIRRLTILSVITGAATTVATVLIQGDIPNKVIGIGGGLTSAGLGGLAAFSSNQSVAFSHTRNLLTDIWQEADTSAIYPPFVWYVLNEPTFSNSRQHTIRYNIRQRWRGYVLDDTSPEQRNLYFGTGGRYQADDLHARANMLNQLQSSVRSINQDLQSLVLAVSRDL